MSDKPRACTNCARAKAKCVWPDDDTGVCQRCSMHKSLCSKSSAVSKKRRGKAIHSKIIEQKLDDIMSLLTNERAEKASTRNLEPDVTLTDLLPPPAQPLSTPQYSAETSPGVEISFAEADRVLGEYMTTMLPQYPFVPVPSCNAQDLYRHKPLLLRTVLWVCRPGKPDEYARFETWFRQHIAHETVICMKKDLELVQAILVFLAWRDIYFYATAKDTTLLQIAIGLIGDLGLNGARRSANPSFRSVVEAATQLRNDILPQPNQTGDGHRAALGVFYIASTLCTILGKRCRLDFTAHFDDCCRQLEQAGEHPTDVLLVGLVRIQKIATKVNDCFHEAPETATTPQETIHSIAVASMRHELDTLMKQLPEHLQANHLIQTHSAAVRIRLFEPLKHTCTPNTYTPSSLRYQTIWDCLQSCRALHGVFCQIPLASYPHLTFASFLHLSLAMIKAMTMLCLEDPAWDTVAARSIYDLPAMLQQTSKLLNDASNSATPRTKILLHDKPMLSEYAEAYQRIERWFSNRIKTVETDPGSSLLDTDIGLGPDQFEGFEFWNQLSDLTYGFVP
ncbi:hypothetical protein BJY04DRAFT_230432 [Aspergillus karnatakaensis]|uniref:fungal specific transcription factor domain-containing protein n=1 Tax=Aspergillus karnatakaensis TaxID=1810916 RepID=UPI003CCD46B5